MNRFIISTLVVILPYMALADTITEIKELRVKIKEKSNVNEFGIYYFCNNRGLCS